MLKKLMLNKQKRDIEEAIKGLAGREAELQTREEELAKAIDEISSEEEMKATDEMISAYEKEKEEHEAKKTELNEQLKNIEDELKELEAKEPKTKEEVIEEGGEVEVRNKKYFGGSTREQVQNILKRQDVKDFLTMTREMKGQRRDAKNAKLLIPDVLVGILRDNIHEYSKLISKVWLRPVKGTTRVILPGAIPEAVWTEACANLNEIAINFNEVEMDGYKVGGFMPICNATLADASDLDLYNEIMYMLAQSIGLAVDKAILYGTGKKMPLGIVTRLAQTAKPDNYSQKAPEWANLSKTNVLQATGDTSEKLFADFVLKVGEAQADTQTGNKFFAMNQKTWTLLQSKLITFNAAGLIVSSMNGTMPIVGGEIVILPFIPDGDIVGGNASMYLLAEREGMEIAVSEHVQFIEDNTVFKGTARYDGAPVIANSFVVVNVAGKAPTTAITFAEDKANAAKA